MFFVSWLLINGPTFFVVYDFLLHARNVRELLTCLNLLFFATGDKEEPLSHFFTKEIYTKRS